MRRLCFVTGLVLLFVWSAGLGGSATPATRIVFSAATVLDQGRYDWQIYSALPSGARVAQLTFGPEPATDPLPSPDGRLILFARGKALWVMRSDGRDARRLVANASDPAWRADSSRVVYAAPDGIRDIDPDGTRSRLLVRFAGSPALSRDGRTMAYAEWAPDHVDVSVRRNGKEWPIIEASGFEELALSPDGRLIAVVGEGPPPLTVFRYDGRPYADLGIAENPRWSPDGRHLAFTREGRLHILNVATRRVRALSRRDPVHGVRSFAWSPAGDWIVYVLGDAGRPSASVQIVSLDSRERSVPLIRQARLGDAVAWSTTPSGLRLRPPTALWTANGNELRLREPVRSLSADGTRTAFLVCNTLAVWHPSTADVTPVRREGVLCGGGDDVFVSGVALAGDRVGWESLQGGTGKLGWLTTAPIAPDAPQTVVSAPRAARTGPDPRGDARSGHLVGDGPLLVFAEWAFCDDLGRPCSIPIVSDRRILAESLWRVREPSWPNACPLSVTRVPYALPVGRCQPLRSEPGPLVPLDVNDGRIVASGDNATVILDPEGHELRSIPVRATSAQLAANELVLVDEGQLRVYDASSGALLRGWGAIGDLQDVAAGLAAYVARGRLHLLRLRDGADVEVGSATRARFGDSGLYYAYESDYPWRGRIRFVPFDRLPIHA
jgi:WD40 repeat protein